MKFSDKHYQSLKEAIIRVKPEIKPVTQKEIWDLFWMSKWSESADYYEGDYLDAHIETAVRHIVKRL